MKTPEELGIPEITVLGLKQIADEIRRGEMIHVRFFNNEGEAQYLDDIPNGINMSYWGIQCGTVHCIGGKLDARGQLPPATRAEMDALFYPDYLALRAKHISDWGSIRAEHVATVIENYLETGKVEWDCTIRPNPEPED